MSILLDTHAFIWFVLDDPELPATAKALVEDPTNDVFISPASYWEIAIKAHEPSTMRFPLDRVQEILDQYATLGKGLNITEFTPTSAGRKISGSHREGVWDEAAQADYAVKFYRVCFAHPAMRAITWWDLSDRDCWQPGGGMLRADMSPKSVYEQLKRLIHEEWKTTLRTTTDNDGRFTFRGFCGTYRLVLDVEGHKLEHRLQVTSGMRKEVVVKLAP